MPIEETKEEISHNDRKAFWARHIISPHKIAFGDVDRILERAWYDLDHVAAQNIFKQIKDGRLYCIQVEQFKRNFEYFEYLDDLGGDFSTLPELSIGCRGTLSLVRTETYRTAPVIDFSSLPRYRPPSWKEIGDGIRERLREDFKPNNLMKWFIKNVVARILYLPDINPEFWGRDAF